MYFYSKKVPNIGDLVLAKIIGTEDLGIKIKLIEYDNSDGYILYSNLLKRKKHAINQEYKQNKDIIVEFVGVFENILSFTDKNLDETQNKEFEYKLKKYMRIFNLVNSFIKTNKDIEIDNFINKVLYQVSNESYQKNDDNDEESEFVEAYDLVMYYERCVKENENKFDLEEPIKTKFFDYLKKHITESKYKGNLKYETVSVNSCGLNDVKNYYTDIINYAKDNNIEIEVKMESTPLYVLYFKEDKYESEIKNKMNKIMEYISNKKININNKLVSNNVQEV